jgi:methionine aminopeptidase
MACLQEAGKLAQQQLKALEKEERALQAQAAELQKQMQEVVRLAPHAEEAAVQQQVPGTEPEASPLCYCIDAASAGGRLAKNNIYAHNILIKT